VLLPVDCVTVMPGSGARLAATCLPMPTRRSIENGPLHRTVARLGSACLGRIEVRSSRIRSDEVWKDLRQVSAGSMRKPRWWL